MKLVDGDISEPEFSAVRTRNARRIMSRIELWLGEKNEQRDASQQSGQSRSLCLGPTRQSQALCRSPSADAGQQPHRTGYSPLCHRTEKLDVQPKRRWGRSVHDPVQFCHDRQSKWTGTRPVSFQSAHRFADGRTQ
jgi:hypothetical protein